MKLAPYFLFFMDNLYEKYPSTPPIMIVSKVRRMATALPGPIELIRRLNIMKELTKAKVALITPEMRGNINPPKKLQAIPSKIMRMPSTAGIFLRKLIKP